jgi:hypothetical protein
MMEHMLILGFASKENASLTFITIIMIGILWSICTGKE